MQVLSALCGQRILLQEEVRVHCGAKAGEAAVFTGHQDTERFREITEQCTKGPNHRLHPVVDTSLGSTPINQLSDKFLGLTEE